MTILSSQSDSEEAARTLARNGLDTVAAVKRRLQGRDRRRVLCAFIRAAAEALLDDGETDSE